MASLGGKALLSTMTAVGLNAALPSLASARASAKVWEKVELPVRETLFDISFDPSRPEHGWLVGAKGTFLETFDEGKTWATRTFNNLDEDEDINYRFEVASLNDNEGWIIGKPAIMLHTRCVRPTADWLCKSPSLTLKSNHQPPSPFRLTGTAASSSSAFPCPPSCPESP